MKQKQNKKITHRKWQQCARMNTFCRLLIEQMKGNLFPKLSASAHMHPHTFLIIHNHKRTAPQAHQHAHMHSFKLSINTRTA